MIADKEGTTSREIGGHRLPLQSPKARFASLHDPQSQEQIGASVGKNARGQAAAAVGHDIVEHATDEAARKHRHNMGDLLSTM